MWWPKLRAHTLNCINEAERMNWEWCVALKPQSIPLGHLPSTKAIPPKSTQTAPSVGYQVFKYTSLWGACFFKPPHPLPITNSQTHPDWPPNSSATSPDRLLPSNRHLASCFLLPARHPLCDWCTPHSNLPQLFA